MKDMRRERDFFKVEREPKKIMASKKMCLFLLNEDPRLMS